MARRIPEEVIEEIKLASDIVALIGDYLPLKRTGKELQRSMPLSTTSEHRRLTSTLMISFSIALGVAVRGNIFTFVMKMEHVGFVEAVELVARRFGIRIPETESSPAQQKARRRDALLEINREALAFFCQLPLAEPPCLEAHLGRRGISEETGPEVPVRVCAGR